MIGVFNDVIDYLTDDIDSTIINKLQQEFDHEKEYISIDKKIEDSKQAVTSFKSSPEGKKRSTLLTRFNLQEKQIKSGAPVINALSVSEITEYQTLDKKWKEVTRPRDRLNQKKKDIKETLDAYCLGRKRDPNSIHNQVEDYWKTKGMDRGKAFGGKFDGKDARKVMEKPGTMFDEGLRAILINGKRNTIEDTYITDLCDDVTVLMGDWNDFFSLLQQEHPTEAERGSAQQVADKVMEAHYNLLGNKTPKVHIAGAHAIEHYLRHRPGLMRLLVEHWVEQNHQESSKIENRFKRVPDLEARANFTAAARHAANNAEVQKRKRDVRSDTSRGKYKKSSTA